MDAWIWLGVAVAGGLGALARFVVDGVVVARLGESPAAGTFVINITGTFVLGLLAGLALSGNAMLIAGTALIGAYTTFSTWMFDTHRLVQDGAFFAGLLNVLVSVSVGFGAVALGHLIGAAL